MGAARLVLQSSPSTAELIMEWSSMVLFFGGWGGGGKLVLSRTEPCRCQYIQCFCFEEQVKRNYKRSLAKQSFPKMYIYMEKIGNGITR